MHKIFYLFLFLILGCSKIDKEPPISLQWEFSMDSETNEYLNKFTITNISKSTLDKEWAIYYSQLPREIQFDSSLPLKIEAVNANFFKISPSNNFKKLEPNESVSIQFTTNEGVSNVSQQPEGVYWINLKKPNEPISINLKKNTLFSEKYQSVNLKKIYDENNLLLSYSAPLTEVDVLPTVKKVDYNLGKITLSEKVALKYDSKFKNEAMLLTNKLKQLYNIDIDEASSMRINLAELVGEGYSKNNELYLLSIDSNDINIYGNTNHGIFNGCQTLLSLLKQKEKPYELSCLTILDYPDLPYRGQMLDIARNFTTVDNIKKLIDVLSSYKINVLHLHLTDDEGWRIEIPGIEELTTVSSKRGHTLDEQNSLLPGYDGNFNANENSSGNGFITRAEYIDLLKYAQQHHVQIIPEIDSPGHARAAIVAMNARYKKYIATDKSKAEEYLLADFNDQSTYVSAQSYTDNVMNVALPSTYKFLEKVFTEIKDMYKDAGVELTSIHIGGDEVPNGAWMKSPACKELIQTNQLHSTKQLSEYFFKKVSRILHGMDLKFNGWQEVALNNTHGNDTEFIGNAQAVYCWNTIAEWDSDEIPYTVANSGYNVILCNVNNFYLDLAYGPHPEERGHMWAGYVNETSSFAMLPYSIYKSSRKNLSGEELNLDSLAHNKLQLNKDSKQNIKGVQAQLFAETIRGYEWVEYYTFPKILGLVERGWNAHPRWDNLTGNKEKEEYNKDLALFYNKISLCEFPYLNKLGVNFRLPHPGIKLIDDKVHINTPITNATIRYTLDGSDPTETSTIWDSPISPSGNIIKSRIFFSNKSSLISTLIITQ